MKPYMHIVSMRVHVCVCVSVALFAGRAKHMSPLHFWCAACPRTNGMWQASCFGLFWHGGTYAKNALHETACLMMKKITQTLSVWVGECTHAIGRGCCRCWTGLAGSGYARSRHCKWKQVNATKRKTRNENLLFNV